MATYMKRLFNLFLGLTLYALGIVFTIQAQIGYAPWEVFHVGMSNTLGISIGTASILAGVVIGAIGIFLGEKVGIGTILNMFLIRRFSPYFIGVLFFLGFLLVSFWSSLING